MRERERERERGGERETLIFNVPIDFVRYIVITSHVLIVKFLRERFKLQRERERIDSRQRFEGVFCEEIGGVERERESRA